MVSSPACLLAIFPPCNSITASPHHDESLQFPYFLTTLVCMGNEAIVLWLSKELALAYFGAVVVGMMGLLQLVATQWNREELRWLPANSALPIGSLMMVGALAWFYISYYRLIFVPGPAGLELMILFSGGSGLAVWLTRLLHWIRTISHE